jgi:uncharacterized protein YPO0396
MKYVTSNLSYEFVVNGITIPKSHYTSTEMNSGGKRLILSLEDEKFEEMMKNSTFKQMIARKRLNVSDTKPANKLSDAEAQRAAVELESTKKQLESVKKQLDEERKSNPNSEVMKKQFDEQTAELNESNEKVLSLTKENEELRNQVKEAAAIIAKLKKAAKK